MDESGDRERGREILHCIASLEETHQGTNAQRNLAERYTGHTRQRGPGCNLNR